jgi:L-asparaginase II
VTQRDVTVATRFDPDPFRPIVVTSRNGVDESLHHGAAVVVDAGGCLAASIGDPEVAIFPRSALKPFQANAMVRAGLELPHRLLAVVTASHSGESNHLEAVVEILDQHGLRVEDLGNTPAHPYGAEANRAALLAGVAPTSLQQNCSGKHAGMLATCRVNDWSVADYLDQAHPLQVAIVTEIERLAGRSACHIGIDGCGAPTHVMPLVDVAQAMRTMMREGSEVGEAMAAHPALVGGMGRDVTLWMEAIPGLAAKEGADGVIVAAMPDGRAGAAKIADGSDLARQTVTVDLLRRMGIDVDAHPGVLERVRVPVLGHGRRVGSQRSLDW